MMNKDRLLALTLVILAAAASRLLPHPENVAPIAAIALFGGAKFERKSLAFFVPFAALLLSDAVLGFYAGIWAVYLAFAVLTCIGFALRGRESFSSVITASLLSSAVFFLITNCNAIVPHSNFPQTMDGLKMGYEAGIPFFRNTLLGDLFYNAVLFGGFAFAERRFGFLRNRILATA